MDNPQWTNPTPDRDATLELPSQRPSALTSATSRRNFLRGAAIATAAATAAGATLTAVAGGTKQSVPQLISSFAPLHNGVSGCALSASMCFESAKSVAGTSIKPFTPIQSFTVHKNTNNSLTVTPSEFFLWATFTDVPNGSYGVTFTIPGDFTLIHDREEPKGIMIDVWQLPACTAPQCPTGELPANKEKHFSSLNDLSHSNAIKVTNGPVDIEVKIYLNYTGALPPQSGNTYTFQASLAGTANIGTTSSPVTAYAN